MRVITAFILAAARRRGRSRGWPRRPRRAGCTRRCSRASRRPGARSMPASPSGSSGATCSASWSATRGWSRGSRATATPTTPCGRRRFWRPTASRATAWTSTALTAVRLLRRLAKEYPASPLIKRADPALKRLVAAAPAASAPRDAGRRLRGRTGPSAAARASATAAVEPVGAPARRSSVGTAVTMPRTPGIARIQAIRRTVLPDVVRIAIELDQEIEYRYERIEGPVRVFLDLVATPKWRRPCRRRRRLTTRCVKSVRLGPRPSRATRVVLDLEGAGRHTVFTLYNPFRIVVDIDRRTGIAGGGGGRAHDARRLRRCSGPRPR